MQISPSREETVARKPEHLLRCNSCKTLPGKATRDCWRAGAELLLYIKIYLFGGVRWGISSYICPRIFPVCGKWEVKLCPFGIPPSSSDPPEASLPAGGGRDSQGGGRPDLPPRCPFAPTRRQLRGGRRPVRTGSFVNCCLCVYLMRCGAASSGGRRAVAQLG